MTVHYSTKWVKANGRWYSPYEWYIYNREARQHVPATDFFEIEDILREARDVIKKRMDSKEDISKLLIRYWEFEARVRKYHAAEIKRLLTERYIDYERYM